MSIQEYISGLISDQQFSDAVNKQHYSFAHRMMPYIVENHFHDLLSKCINESAQDWILQIWREGDEIAGSSYATLVYPVCCLTQPSDEFGVILISMPAPRVPSEAVYAAVMFAVDKSRLPSEWLRYYFTLELALDTSAHWVLGAWDDSKHLNFGDFEYEPTVENFLKVIVAKCEQMWEVILC